MRVERAEVLGMCFGVRDALKALGRIERPDSATILGDLVHNPEVTRALDQAGFRRLSERDRDRPPATPTVVVTAHGISDARRARLVAAGLELVDTTCPLVRRVHRAAQAFRDDGDFVVVIGRRGHVEVAGIVEDLDPDRSAIVESPAEVRTFPSPRIGVVCQSTTSPALEAEIRQALEASNPQAVIRWADTICQPTRDHQEALDRLIARVQGVVVVGGRHSNNTRELVRRCEAAGRPTWHVERAEELDLDWFRGIEHVGLTAGTSTLDATIDEVHRRLESFSTG